MPPAAYDARTKNPPSAEASPARAPSKGKPRTPASGKKPASPSVAAAAEPPVANGGDVASQIEEVASSGEANGGMEFTAPTDKDEETTIL